MMFSWLFKKRAKREAAVSQGVLTSPPKLIALEPRIMFDGAVVDTVIDHLAVMTDSDSSSSLGGDALHVSAFDLMQTVLVAQQAQQQLGTLLEHTDQMLKAFVQTEGFAQKMAVIYGESLDSIQFQQQLEKLRQDVLRDALHLSFEIRSNSELQGHGAAFTLDRGDGTARIFVNRDWLSGEGAQLESALLEEIGHSFDQRFHGVTDSRGDEGEWFSLVARGVQISSHDLQRIQNEHDQGVLQIDGQNIAVEFVGAAVPSFTSISPDTGSNSSDFVGGFTSTGQSLTLNGSVTGVLNPGDNVQVSRDGGSSWNNAVVTGSTWSYVDPRANFTAGTREVVDYQVRVSDALGNVGNTAAQQVIIDQRKPDITVDLRATNSLTPVFSGTLYEAGTSQPVTMFPGNSFQVIVFDQVSPTIQRSFIVTPDGTGSWVLDTASNPGSGSLSFADMSSYNIQVRYYLDGFQLNVFSLNGALQIDSTLPSPPIVDTQTTAAMHPVVTGTATLQIGDMLTIEFNGATYHNVAVDSAGNWSLDSALVTPDSGTLGSFNDTQSYDVRAIVTRLDGRQIFDNSSGEVTIDRAQPTVMSIVTNNPRPTVFGTYQSSNAMANTLTVQVNGSSYVLGSNPELTVLGDSWHLNLAGLVTPIPDGVYNVVVTVNDLLGNPITDAGINELTIDLAPPAVAPTIDALITQSMNPVITGAATLALGETLSVQINGGIYENITVVGGVWSVDTSVAADVGSIGPFNPGVSYPVVATVSDAAGNMVSNAVATQVTIDTTAPLIPAISIVSSRGDPTLGTVGDVVTVTFTTDGTEAMRSATINGNAAMVTATGNPNEYTATYTLTAGDPVGAVNFSVSAADAAGNVTVVITVTDGTSVTFDPISPVTPIFALSTDSGISMTDLITNVGVLNITAIEVGARVEYSLDGGVTWIDQAITPFTAIEGVNSVQVRQVDVASNVSGATTLNFTLDTLVTTPTVSLTADSGVAGDLITNVNTLNITTVETGALVEYSIDGGVTWIDQVVSPFAATIGSNSVQVRQTDIAGNVSSASIFNFTFDNTAPPPPSVDAQTTADVNPIITGTATLALG
ncbi:MAG: hypothetical protein HQM07_09415, partial [Zetaproteobacteria bacterium]|nr:hypothetical protein [Zetaproteobacteria bacterium]